MVPIVNVLRLLLFKLALAMVASLVFRIGGG